MAYYRSSIPPELPESHPHFPPEWGLPGYPPPRIGPPPPAPTPPQPPAVIRSWPSFDASFTRRPPTPTPLPPSPRPSFLAPRPPVRYRSPSPLTEQDPDLSVGSRSRPSSGYRHVSPPPEHYDQHRNRQPYVEHNYDDYRPEPVPLPPSEPSISESSVHDMAPPSHISHEESEAPSWRSHYSNISKSHDCPRRGCTYVDEARDPGMIDHRYDPSFRNRLDNGWQHVHVERRVKFTPSTKGGSSESTPLQSPEQHYASNISGGLHRSQSDRAPARRYCRDHLEENSRVGRHGELSSTSSRYHDSTPDPFIDRTYYPQPRKPRSIAVDATAATVGSSASTGRVDKYRDRDRYTHVNTTAARAGSSASTRHNDRDRDAATAINTTAATVGSTSSTRGRNRDRDTDMNTTATTVGSTPRSHPSTRNDPVRRSTSHYPPVSYNRYSQSVNIAATTKCSSTIPTTHKNSYHRSSSHERTRPHSSKPHDRGRSSSTSSDKTLHPRARTHSRERYTSDLRPHSLSSSPQPNRRPLDPLPMMSGALPPPPPPPITPTSPSPPRPPPPKRSTPAHYHTPHCTHPSDAAAAAERDMAHPDDLIREEAAQRRTRGNRPPLTRERKRVVCDKALLCGGRWAVTGWWDRVRGWRWYCEECWGRKVGWHGRYWGDALRAEGGRG